MPRPPSIHETSGLLVAFVILSATWLAMKQIVDGAAVIALYTLVIGYIFGVSNGKKEE